MILSSLSIIKVQLVLNDRPINDKDT